MERLRYSTGNQRSNARESSRELMETDFSDSNGPTGSDEDYVGSPLGGTHRPDGSDRSTNYKCNWRVRYIKNRAACLVLVWNLLVFNYQYAVFNSILKLLPAGKGELWSSQFVLALFQVSLPQLFYPLAGWIADTKFGRYRVMRASIWIMWLAGMALAILSTIHYSRSDSSNSGSAILVALGIVYIMNVTGLAGFHVNIIPFGIDQMEDGSAEEYSCFIHWYYWSRNFNLGLVIQIFLFALKSYCSESSSVHTLLINLVVLVLDLFFLTLAICLDFFLSNWLIKEPKNQNPLKTVREVSTFVLKHNQPVGRRSALTFTWGAGLPSRSDLAKRRFGGPFDEEDVEAVKAFWNIFVFLFLSIGGFVILNGAVSHCQYKIIIIIKIYCCDIFAGCLHNYSFCVSCEE